MIGGGGKTSLLYYLTALLTELAIPTIATTTTKLAQNCPSEYQYIVIHSMEEVYQEIQSTSSREKHPIFVTGPDPQNNKKILGIPREWVDQLASRGTDKIILVEGDGSAGKSLKGHLPHEPVIPDATNLVIVVLGIDSVGAPLTAKQVHRPERIVALVSKELGAVATTELITRLLFHEEGYLQHCPKQSELIFFINKVESIPQQGIAEKLAKEILAYQHPQTKGVMIGSLLKKEGRWLQA